MSSSRRVCICGSMTFINEIEALALDLRDMGYEVHTPDREGTAFDWDELGEEQRFSRKREYIDAYLNAIRHSDLVLIANYPKRGITASYPHFSIFLLWIGRICKTSAWQ